MSDEDVTDTEISPLKLGPPKRGEFDDNDLENFIMPKIPKRNTTEVSTSTSQLPSSALQTPLGTLSLDEDKLKQLLTNTSNIHPQIPADVSRGLKGIKHTTDTLSSTPVKTIRKTHSVDI